MVDMVCKNDRTDRDTRMASSPDMTDSPSWTMGDQTTQLWVVQQVALLSQRDRATCLSVEILQLQNIAIAWHYLRDPTFSRFYTIPKCDRHTHTDGQTLKKVTNLSNDISIGSTVLTHHIGEHSISLYSMRGWVLYQQCRWINHVWGWCHTSISIGPAVLHTMSAIQ